MATSARRPSAATAIVAVAAALFTGCGGEGALGPGAPADDDDSVVEPVDPDPDGPWLRRERAAPGSVTFTELHYHPRWSEDLEWLELHNPMVLDMDLSGWRLDGGLSHAFVDGTVLPAGGYLVVASDPDLLASDTGFDGALGPYEGRLSNGGERIELYANGGRLIDTVRYGDDAPWPVHPDGSGHTLAKVDADAASDHAENWTVSAEPGGSPGRSNGLDPLTPATVVELVSLEASTWSYDVSGDYPAADWAAPDYDDSGWEVGQAVFFAGGAEVDVPATAWITADNYYGLYLGRADGSDLRLVGEDPDGDWTTVEGFELLVTPEDHLYVAAWEAPGDSGGPQMAIAEVELPQHVVGTDASGFQWILGPVDASPGTAPTDPPPDAELLESLVVEAEADGTWTAPGVEADRSSGPWGGAVGAAFGDPAKYIWADTFDAVSVTNSDNTYALFRTVAPLSVGEGTTELPALPTTALFRTAFVLESDPASTDLLLECLVDDGAVVSLDGVEVHRVNMPDGPVDADTLAASPVEGPSRAYAWVAADGLEQGTGVLSVEVHQAEADDLDLTFGCALTARVAPEVSRPTPTVLLSEVPSGSTSPFWVELWNGGGDVQDTAGLVLATSAGEEVELPAVAITPDQLLLVDDVGLDVEVGDALFLFAADGLTLLDAVRVGEEPRARDVDRSWRFASEASPGGPNVVDRTEDVVIHEIQYHRAPLSQEDEPVTLRSDEWIELYNRGSTDVDLGGWRLVDAVAWEFPEGTVLASDAYLVVAGDAEALREERPDIDVVGDFTGRLDNAGDRILLLDAAGNPADEVPYFDGGRWPAAADGGGSTLELRDAWADNTAPEAWSASEEATRARWVDYGYRGPAEPSAVGPDGLWEELVLGLLGAGEVLLDDLRVVADPDGAAVELLPDGTFDEGGGSWRLLGNHRHSEVVPDPDDPANPVLRLVATGPTGHMHNHAETTLLQPVGAGEYEISFRARWVSGSNQLNTRLYFNRLPRTTRVEQPELSGTPGAPNSTATDDLGPTFDACRHEPAVPSPFEPVSVQVGVDDPDGVDEVALWSSVDGAPFAEQAMTEVAPGRWQAELEGRPAGSIVQFYAEARDALGASSTFPAAGRDSRALIRFDSPALSGGLHDLRIILTGADSDWLHSETNLMSDDLVGATVVYREAEVFYDVGVRAKGSERGRPMQPRLGYAVRFHDDRPFRGSHTTVLVDRSEGVGFGQREVLLNLVMTHGGSEFGEHNDLVRVHTPRPEHAGPAELQIDRFADLVLDSQFEEGADGRLFEYELIYHPLTTEDGTAEGLKLPLPDGVVGTPLTDLGDDPEAYRWTFLVENNEREDDFEGLIELCRTFGLPQPDFGQQVGEVIDVDQWLRAFAFATLAGVVDQYGSGAQHNAQFYLRPADGRFLYFPHDLDFFGSAQMAVVGNGDLARLIQDPLRRRSWYGHLQDIVEHTYNGGHLAPWCDQLGALLPEQDFASHCQFIDDRADWVMEGSPDAVLALYPPLDFAITTAGGEDFTVSASEVELEGEGWIDVRSVVLADTWEPMPLSWLDDRTWQVVVPLVPGANDLTLVATDLRSEAVGSDSIVVTSEPGP